LLLLMSVVVVVRCRCSLIVVDCSFAVAFVVIVDSVMFYVLEGCLLLLLTLLRLLYNC
jgi:hypothetical protein